MLPWSKMQAARGLAPAILMLGWGRVDMVTPLAKAPGPAASSAAHSAGGQSLLGTRGVSQRASWLAALEILALSMGGNNFQRDGVWLGHVSRTGESSTPSLHGENCGLCQSPDRPGGGGG